MKVNLFNKFEENDKKEINTQQLFSKKINKIKIKEKIGNYFFINSLCNPVPLKIKILNISGMSIKVYFSRNNKKPGKNHYDQLIEIEDAKKTYQVHCDENNKEFFTCQNIFLSVESDFILTANVVINFGQFSMYVYRNNMSTSQIREVRDNRPSRPSIIENDINFFMMNEENANKLFRKTNKKIFDQRIHLSKIKLPKYENSTILYIDFLKKRNLLLKLREERTKSAKKFTKAKYEQSVLMQTLKLNKWKLLEIEVKLNREEKLKKLLI